jgi:glycosyltransferase involved in cell wall biosynthesis
MDFLCGVPYLQARGYRVDILELTDLHPDPQSSEYQDLCRQNASAQQIVRYTSTSHHLVESIDRLNQYDAVVAGNESVAFGIAHFIRAGAVRTPLFYFGTGMLAYAVPGPHDASILKRLAAVPRELYSRLVQRRYQRAQRMYRELIESSHAAILFGWWDYQHARQMFPDLSSRVYFLPFAVDTEFWRPDAGRGAQDDSILFMGNDRPRDYALVLEIARRLPEFTFVFVTKVISSGAVPRNVRLKAGDWKDSLLSDVDIREIVHRSALVILPLKATYKPSGQSVTLQAMACGKPVMISKRDGFWEPESVVDREHVWFVHSSRPEAWCKSIRTIMGDAGARARIGANARALVERGNNLELFGRELEAILVKNNRPSELAPC